MGMSVNPLNNRSRKKQLSTINEINMTPFIDVVLVLLIVFMVTAPLMTVGVQVDLPKTQAKALTEDKQPLVVSINAAGDIFIMDMQTTLDGLAPKLQAITENNHETKIYIRGDTTVSYGQIMQIMGLINAAGFSKVALIGRQSNQKDDAQKQKPLVKHKPEAPKEKWDGPVLNEKK